MPVPRGALDAVRRTPGSWARACHADRGLLPLFADWLEERGDDRRAAVRWLAREGKWPHRWLEPAGSWRPACWHTEAGSFATRDPSVLASLLPHRLFTHLHHLPGSQALPVLLVRSYRTPEAAVLDLLRVWRPERVEG